MRCCTIWSGSWRESTPSSTRELVTIPTQPVAASATHIDSLPCPGLNPATYTHAISHRDTAMSVTTVFTNNRSQAVRLPADVRLPEGVKKVQVRARGVDRIISPVGHTWDEFFLNGPQASEDFMADRAAQLQAEREAF